ncbi:MAG: hypothetical protein E6K85_05005 [Thaumarchaeota archaeon]|nr:MAG: hypothetical protein E6K85_05005 [Nitrososphaerota archaeon]
MNARLLIVAALLSAVAIGTIVVLSQAQIIFLPYFTPAKIEFQGLQDEYPVNGSMTYTVSLKGYGSNCIGFTAQTVRKEDSLPKGEERVAYFSKTDDCRKISISQGPYNYSQSFSYSGHVVLGHPGDYRVEVAVYDEISKQNSMEMRAFRVK